MAASEYIPRMRSLYNGSLRADLMKELQISNIMLVPKIDKIIFDN